MKCFVCEEPQDLLMRGMCPKCFKLSGTSKETGVVSEVMNSIADTMVEDPDILDRMREKRARLLAVAPELLEALKECTKWMESLRVCGDAGNWDWNDDEYTRAMSIIAKAEGRS